MAFRLPLKDLQRGFAKVAGAQIARISKAGIPVLEQRKSLKKLRALASLAATDSNTKALRRGDRLLRDLGRQLGQTRDADALRTTLDLLVAAEMVTGQALQRRLREALVDGADAQGARTMRLDAQAVAAAFAAIDLRHVSRGSAVGAISQSYRAARAGYGEAQDVATGEAMHDWRKAVQRHARHLQLLADLWPAEFEMRIVATKSLARHLGEDHDLDLFVIWLEAQRLPTSTRADSAALSRSIRARQMELREMAAALGGKVFAERPRHFRRRLKVYARTI